MECGVQQMSQDELKTGKRKPNEESDPSSEERIKALEHKLEELTLENNRIVMEQKDLFDEAEHLRRKIAAISRVRAMPGAEAASVSADKEAPISLLSVAQEYRPIYSTQEAIELRYSYSYRLGRILLDAVCRPGKNTLLMPYYLVQLVWDMVTGRGRLKVKNELERTMR